MKTQEQIIDLKAQAYDLLATKEQIDLRLRQINQQLMELSKISELEKSKELAKPKEPKESKKE